MDDMSEKVEEDEEERDVTTVREALALSISSEYKFTTKYTPTHTATTVKSQNTDNHCPPGPKFEASTEEREAKGEEQGGRVLHKHPVGSWAAESNTQTLC